MNIIDLWNKHREYNIKALASDKVQEDRLLGIHHTSDVATSRKEHKKKELLRQWGVKRHITHIIIHHSDTPETMKDARTLQILNDTHRKFRMIKRNPQKMYERNGQMYDIAYHYGIGTMGKLFITTS